MADEYLATRITLREMDRLRRRSPAVRPLGLRAVEGEHHIIGAQMVSDFLAIDGWQVDFLGANTPTPDLVAFVAQRGPDLVALAVTIDENLVNARAAITALKGLPYPPKVLVAGLPSIDSHCWPRAMVPMALPSGRWTRSASPADYRVLSRPATL